MKKELTENCYNQIRQIQAQKPGAELVCPEGDCNGFCESAAQSQDMRSCSGITNEQGYESCLEGSARQLSQSLPQGNPARLPEGFAWENCDLGKFCEQSLQIVFNKTVMECSALKEQAVTCCEKPLECADQNSLKLFAKPGAGPAGDIAKICRTAKEKLGNIGDTGQKMAEKCRNSAVHCGRACGQKTGQMTQSFYEVCAFDLSKEQAYDPAQHTCSKSMIEKYITAYREQLSPVFSSCETTGLKSKVLAQSAEEILKSALSALRCEQQAGGGGSARPV